MTPEAAPEADTPVHQLSIAFADLRQYLSTPTRAIEGAENALTRIETAATELDDSHTTQLIVHGCRRIREEIEAMQTTAQKQTARQTRPGYDETSSPLSSDPRQCREQLEVPCTSAELRCDRALEYLEGMQFQLTDQYYTDTNTTAADTTANHHLQKTS